MEEIRQQPLGLIITDLHLSDQTVAQVVSIFDQAIELAKQLRVQYVFCLGDLFTSRKGQSELVLRTFRGIIDKFTAEQIYFLTIAGNHDKTSYVSDSSFLDPFVSEYFRVVSLEENMVFDRINLMFLSYYDEQLMYQTKLMECMKNLDPSRDNLLFTHCAIDGVRNNAGIVMTNEVPAHFFAKFKRVFVGHYHNQQIFHNIVYVGSTDPRNFGEDDEKGCTVLYDDGSVQFIKFNFRSYVTVDLLAEDLNPELLRQTQEKLTESNVRLRIQGTLSEQLKPLLVNLGQVGAKVELHKEVTVGEVQQVTHEVIVTSGDLLELYDSWAEDRKVEGREQGRRLLEEVL